MFLKFIQFNTLIKIFLLLTIISTFLLLEAFSQTTTRLTVRGTGLPVPRFVSLKTEKSYMRKGPSQDRPIDWVYNIKGLPLKVVAEFDDWMKIVDSRGETGWMHRSLLSSKRTIEVTRTNLELRKMPNLESEVIARAEIGAILNIRRCDKTWCRLNYENITGWAHKKGFFGLLKDEIPD